MSVVIAVLGLVFLGAVVHLAQRLSDRIAYGPGRRSTTSDDAISASQYDRKRGDVSGLGGM